MSGFDDAVRSALAEQVGQMIAQRDAWEECARKGVRLVEKIITEQTYYGDTARAVSDLFDLFDRLSDGEFVGPGARAKIAKGVAEHEARGQ